MITSASNKRIKDIQKLKENKNIKKYGRYLIEGKHLVEEALDAKVVEEIIVSESFEEYNIVDSFEGELIKVTDSVLKSMSDTITSQGIIAVCRTVKKELDINNYSKVLILDKIQDPGNLGTIIRTADAFNFDCIILGKGTTSLYGQKVIRSTQGSNFHIDCFDNIDLVELIDEMHEFNIFATSLKADKYIEQLDNITGKVAVVFGNEGAGVSEEILSKVNNLLKISMPGRAESLNVSIAAGIVMHYISTKLK
jgi:putative tRNA/rRNA methyltransferase